MIGNTSSANCGTFRNSLVFAQPGEED